MSCTKQEVETLAAWHLPGVRCTSPGTAESFLRFVPVKPKPCECILTRSVLGLPPALRMRLPVQA